MQSTTDNPTTEAQASTDTMATDSDGRLITMVRWVLKKHYMEIDGPVDKIKVSMVRSDLLLMIVFCMDPDFGTFG